MRQYRLLSPMIKVVIVLFSLLFSTAQAGLVIGGTRFAYPENQSSISVELKNTSDRDMLVKVAVSPDDARQLTGTVESLPSFSGTVFIATPPLFVLKPDENTKIRINRVGGSLPADRESLFILNVAALPSLENSHPTKTDNQLQIAVRNRMKIFYRPSNLSEDPNISYQKLRWARKNEIVTVYNPGPRYVTLYNLHVDGKVMDGGMIAPFSHRQQSWCKAQGICEITWQTLDIYNNVLPVWKVNMNPLQMDVSGSQFKTD
ncbi:TPA: molecular chaperone [Escherichia coli]|nr:molecular chaperone [Escherichia coli]